MKRLLCSFCFLAALYAQSPTPPKILEIHRERLKPGAAAEYEKIEAAAGQTCRDMACPNPYLAIQSATGPAEVWLLNGFDSLEAMERVWGQYAENAALLAELDRVVARKAELTIEPQTILARYRDDLSRDLGTPLARMRYLSIETFYLRPGSADDFEQSRRLSRATHERSRATESHLVYEAFSGTADAVFFVLTPMRSLTEAERLRGRAVVDAATRAKTLELVRASVASSETALFLFSPSMSYTSKEWAGADPEFWEPKAQAIR